MTTLTPLGTTLLFLDYEVAPVLRNTDDRDDTRPFQWCDPRLPSARGYLKPESRVAHYATTTVVAVIEHLGQNDLSLHELHSVSWVTISDSLPGLRLPGISFPVGAPMALDEPQFTEQSLVAQLATSETDVRKARKRFPVYDGTEYPA